MLPVFHGERDPPMIPQILGIYCSQKTEKMGTGGTAKDFVQKIYWFILQLDDESFLVYPLGDAYIPLAVTKRITVKEFISHYLPEPVYYRDHTFPIVSSIQRKLREQDGLDGLDAKEKDFIKLLGLAKKETPSELTSEQLALRIIAQASLDAQRLEMAQRKNINTFGIQLRKDKNFDGAINYYQKALDLNPADDHVHFNIARAYFDKNDLEKSLSYLDHALKINPDFLEAAKFRNYILRTTGVQDPRAGDMPQAAPQPKVQTKAQDKAQPKAQDDVADLGENDSNLEFDDLGIDRRRRPRLSLREHGVKHICMVRRGDETFKAALLDISQTGAKLLLPRDFEVIIQAGDVLVLDSRIPITGNGAAPAIRCVGRWARDKQFGVMFESELPLDIDELPVLLKKDKP